MIKTLSSLGAGSSVLIGMTALLLTSVALALDPNLTIKQLHHTAWGPSQGAPLGGAAALAQTNDGYLWMAGPSGLYRFDGIAFERVELFAGVEMLVMLGDDQTSRLEQPRL